MKVFMRKTIKNIYKLIYIYIYKGLAHECPSLRGPWPLTLAGVGDPRVPCNFGCAVPCFSVLCAVPRCRALVLPSAYYMVGIVFKIFLIFVLIANYHTIQQKETEKNQSACKEEVVLAQGWIQSAHSQRTWAPETDPSKPPLQRLSVPPRHPSQDGGCAVVLSMWPKESKERLALWGLQGFLDVWHTGLRPTEGSVTAQTTEFQCLQSAMAMASRTMDPIYAVGTCAKSSSSSRTWTWSRSQNKERQEGPSANTGAIGTSVCSATSFASTSDTATVDESSCGSSSTECIYNDIWCASGSAFVTAHGRDGQIPCTSAEATETSRSRWRASRGDSMRLEGSCCQGGQAQQKVHAPSHQCHGRCTQGLRQGSPSTSAAPQPVEKLPGREPQTLARTYRQFSGSRSATDGEDPAVQGSVCDGKGHYERKQDGGGEHGPCRRQGWCSSGLRRRGASRGAYGSCSAHRDRLEQPCQDHVTVANSDGGASARRTTRQKTARLGRGQRRIGWQRCSHGCFAAFWCARWQVTNAYCHHGRSPFGDALPDASSLALKWCHSIMNEVCFISEWQAIESAHALAFKLHRPGLRERKVNDANRAPRARGQKKFNVTFSDSVEVHMGDRMHCVMMPHHALFAWPCKPWALTDEHTMRTPEVMKMLSRRPPPPTSWPSSTWIQVSGDASLHRCAPLARFSIMDEFVDFPHIPHDPGEPHHDPHAHGQRDPARVPDFTDNMLSALDPMWNTPFGMLNNGILVRTWYVHHTLLMRNDDCRVVRLPPDRSQWIGHLTAAWEDTLDATIATAFTLPSPMPTRGPHDQLIALDVILAQGLHEPRFSGLVSVHHVDENDGLGASISAASFPAWVSSYHVLDAARVLHLCQEPDGRVCHVLHGWHRLPSGTAATHRMRPGHSFMIQIPHDPSLESASAHAGELTQVSAAVHGLPGGTGDEHFDTGPSRADHDPPDDDQPSSVPPSHGHDSQDDPLFNCHFYRLRHPPLHMFMRNAAGVPMLMELARNLNIVPASLLQAHSVQAPMVGDCRDDFSFIIQSTADLPAASSDVLVIIDVEVHFHVTPAGVHPLPAATRRVHRVPRHLARVGVLHYAGVRQYCAWQHDSCLVEHNGQSWPKSQAAPKLMRHGTYLRVTVPPPDNQLNTLQAIHVAEHPTLHVQEGSMLMNAAPFPAPAPSPATSTTTTPLGEAQVHLPQLRDDRWFDQLDERFENDAMLEFEEEGPIMYVWTWFIHHDLHPRCDAPRVVKLDSFKHLWKQDLMQPWQSLLQPSDSSQILVVGHQPPCATTTLDTVHIMIEQNPREARAAAVLSAIFHGDLEDRLLQQAYSVPRWLCTEDIIDILRINHVCETRRCSARSGVAHFDQFIRHDVHDAISIELHVRPPQCDGDQQAASSTDPFVPRRLMPTTGNALLQTQRSVTKRRQMEHTTLTSSLLAVNRSTCWNALYDAEPEVASTAQTLLHDPSPALPVPADKIDDDFQQVRGEMQRIVNRREQFHQVPPGTPQMVHDLHDLLIMNNQEWNGRLPDAIVIAVWYADHERRPHSGLNREVHLTADVTRWYHDIVMVWEDWIDPFASLSGIIVHPQPMDGNGEVQAHILLVQHAQPPMCSIVVAIVDTHDDPWHPRLLCLTVPCILSHAILRGYVDLDGICDVPSLPAICRTFLVDRDLTHVPQFEAAHGMHLVFHVQRQQVPVLADVPTVHESEVPDTHALDDMSFLQKSPHRTTLSLDELVPSPKFTSVDCQRVIFLREQMQLVDTFRPDTEFSQVWWHSSTWSSLAHVPLWHNETVLGLTLYTDGSAWRSHERAAAGVFLLLHTNEGLRCGGFITAKCIGQATAPRAEATALLLAAMWMFQLASLHTATASWFEIAYDCEHTANIAQGRQVAHSNSDISVILRSLIQWLEVILPSSITWTHHRSHQGDPWNEAADAICRHALQHDVFTTSIEHWFDTCSFQGQDLCSVQWLWLLEKSVRHHVDAPSLQGTQWRFDVSTPFATPPSAACHPAVLRRRVLQDEGHDHFTFRLKIATANVLTMFPGQEFASNFFSARAESLARQFLHEDLHAIGIQETRSRSSGHSFFEDFHVISAPATKRGHGGIQLWIRKTFSLPEGSIDVDVADLRILHASSQRLVVRWAYPGCRLVFVVLHAPTDEEDDTLQSFWDATTASIPVAYRQWPTIVMADANSRVGSNPSSAVGTHQADEENGKGACFHGWLLNHDLFLPQTLAECHVGHGDTWTHPKGTTARIDFLAISNNISPSDVSTWVSERIDLALHRKDHDCVCAELSLTYYPADRRPRDKRARSALPSTITDVWSLDVHTHAAQLQHWIRQRNPACRTWRKRHLTDVTKQLIDAKRYHWKRLNSVRRHFRYGLLRQIFEAWRSPQPLYASSSAWIKDCDQAIAWHQWAFHDLAPHVVRAVRDDDQDFYNNLATEEGMETSKGCRQMWKAIQHALPRWRCKRRSNLRCTGPSLEEQFQHYDALEAGHCLPYEDLLAQCHNAQRDDAADIPLQIPLASLPSRLNVEAIGCRIQTQKAPGIDWVAPAALQQMCQQSSAALHQFMLKVWILGAEPLQGKGGLLHPIAKKEVSQKIEGMRGIMLIDGLGKLIHTHLRRQFSPALESMRLPLQLGGFARSSTLFATTYVRAFTQLAARQSLSSAVIFVDIRSAFHSMIRQLVFGGEKIHPKLQQILVDAQVDLPALQTRLDQPPPLEAAPISQVAARLLRDGHRFTWYTLGASEAVHQTERGSRPGSPLADVAFNSLMALVLRELQLRLDQHAPLQVAFALLGIRALPVAWVDDLAVPVVAQHATALTPVIQWTLGALTEVCQSFGLQLNLQQRKTEVVPTFRGDDAPACRQKCFQDDFARISVGSFEHSVKCVPLYEHLGTMFQGDGGIEAELRHRTRKACLAYRQVQRALLRNRHLTIAVRLRLLEALILPILFHGAGNWPLLGSQQMLRLHGTYLKWVRSVVGNGFWTHNQMSDVQLLLHWRLPSVALRLAKHRLLFAFHLFVDAPHLVIDVVTAVADAPRSWLHALRQALVWVQSVDASFLKEDPLTMTTAAIVQWVHANRVDGPRRVRRIFKHVLHQGVVVEAALHGHQVLRHQLEIGGAAFEEVEYSSEMTVLPHECAWCAKTFATQRQWQNHLWSAHGEPSDERRYMTTTVCPSCWTCCWTVNRLQIHLRHSRRHSGGCYERLTWTHDPLEQIEPIVEMTREDRPQRLPAAVVPHVMSDVETRCTSREIAMHRWRQACRDENFNPLVCVERVNECKCTFDNVLRDQSLSSTADPDSVLWRLTCIAEEHDLRDPTSSAGSGALALWMLDDLRFSRFPQIDVQFFGRCRQAIRCLVQQSPVGHLVCWKRRMDEAYSPAIAAAADPDAAPIVALLERILDPVREQHALLRSVLQPLAHMPSCQGVPIEDTDNGPVVWILHLFSGRRRVGDCHWWVERIGHLLWPGVTLRIVSLDTAVHATLGDLATGPNLERVQRLSRKGYFAGVLTGPPCETWSEARHIELPDGRGPRPLRSKELPWCMPERTGREMEQCAMGTQLLTNSWAIETAAVMQGAAAIMEHPWEGDQEDHASVWKTAAHQQWIMALPNAHRHYIQQYLYGAKGVKPTCLRAINLGAPSIMDKILEEGAEPWRTRPTTQLAGRTESGAFRTAAAKEYSSALCRTMVVALVKGLRIRSCTEGCKGATACSATDHEWLLAAWRASAEYTRTSYLPDYQGKWLKVTNSFCETERGEPHYRQNGKNIYIIFFKTWMSMVDLPSRSSKPRLIASCLNEGWSKNVRRPPKFEPNGHQFEIETRFQMVGETSLFQPQIPPKH